MRNIRVVTSTYKYADFDITHETAQERYRPLGYLNCVAPRCVRLAPFTSNGLRRDFADHSCPVFVKHSGIGQPHKFHFRIAP